jgi:hypothetical protein
MDLRHAPRTLLSLGAVNVSGIPVTGQVAVWNSRVRLLAGYQRRKFDASERNSRHCT